MSIDWARFRQIVEANSTFILTSHVRPDCDALGSELGMAGILESLGKRVEIVNPHPTPPNLAFIDAGRRIRAIGIDVQARDLPDYDVHMVLDTSAWIQLGDMAEVFRATRARRVVLDHHLSQDDLGAEVFKDVKAEATGRLVLDAAEQLGVSLTAEMASPLFAAVATDTGWFRFSSTSPTTFEAAARLTEAGARPDRLYAQLYEQDTVTRLNLIGRVLARAQSEQNGRLIHTHVTREDFDLTGAVSSDTEDVINMTLAVGGTEVAVILVALPNGKFKVSFRSRSTVDCSRLAEQFKGGGHKAAAGATVEGPLEIARERILDAVRAAMS
jgi:phosphoesterase RecJ-like protein